jgi:HlyD family secretion protein
MVAVAWQLDTALPEVARSALWIEAVSRGELVHEIRASGTLVPREARWIAAGTAGTVQEVLVLPGAEVAAGTVLMQLTNRAVLEKLEQAQATLAVARANVEAARTSLTSQLLDHRSALARAQAGFEISSMKATAHARAAEQGVISRFESEQSQINAQQDRNLRDLEEQRVTAFGQNLQAQLQAVTARQSDAASALAIAQQDVEALTVKAGVDGIVQQVAVEAGQQVLAGANLARIARPNLLLARLRVQEVQAKDLRAALAVQIDTRNGMVKGEISRIDPAVREGGVSVDVALNGALPPGARPDLSIEGSILLGRLRNVLHVARPPFASPNTTTAAFVIKRGTEIAQRLPVRFGAGSGGRLVILSGLAPGDELILSDTSQWSACHRQADVRRGHRGPARHHGRRGGVVGGWPTRESVTGATCGTYSSHASVTGAMTNGDCGTGDRALCHDSPCCGKKAWFFPAARRVRGGVRMCPRAVLECSSFSKLWSKPRIPYCPPRRRPRHRDPSVDNDAVIWHQSSTCRLGTVPVRLWHAASNGPRAATPAFSGTPRASAAATTTHRPGSPL